MEKRKILVVIDAQNDFIDGSLRNEEAIKATPKIVEKINEFDGKYILVTKDTHDANYLQTKEGQKLPVVHCVKGTEGWNLNSNIQSALNDAEAKGVQVLYFEKPTFGSVEMMDFVSMDEDFEGNLDIEICGFCTDICVLSNAMLLKAALYNRANISIIEDCCAGVTPQTHSAALTAMKSCQINVI